MNYTAPSHCSICDEPLSICQCQNNPAVRPGVRMGNTCHEEIARSLSKVPMEDRVLFFAGFMATCLGHMKAAIGQEAARAVIDGIKVLADSSIGALKCEGVTGK